MINTITLNPAVDKILFIDKFEKGVTARIERKAEALGGKGVHISVSLKLMGVDNSAFGILFGATGRFVEATLSGMGVNTEFVTGADGGGETRSNYVIIERDKASTIIADKGVMLSEDEVCAIIERLRDKTRKGDTLVFSGDASNARDPHIYNRIMDDLSDKQCRVFIDASGETLKKALKAKPFLIKPNRDELESIMDERVTSLADVIRGISSIEKSGVENAVVSLGAEGSVALLSGTLWRAEPPDVAVANTAGCGDCFLAGLIRGLNGGWEPERILRYATAASAAAATSPLSVGFDTGYADSLFDKVKLQKL